MACHYKQKNSMKDFSKCACHNEQNYLDCVLSRARCLTLLIVAIITTEILLCPIATSLIAPALSLSPPSWSRVGPGDIQRFPASVLLHQKVVWELMLKVQADFSWFCSTCALTTSRGSQENTVWLKHFHYSRGRSTLHSEIQAVFLPWVNTSACTEEYPSCLHHTLWPDI